MLIVYFSTKSLNTHRFVGKLGLPAVRIPCEVYQSARFTVDEPYVLFVPTYGGGNIKGAVPRPVIQFLNQPDNRALIRGVVSSGNTNFFEAYCIAGDIIAKKCNVPFLDKYELLGTPDDVQRVRNGLLEFWKTLEHETAGTPA